VTLAADSYVTPALVVSVLALVFTMLSFWWIQVRRGRLVTFPPQSYAAGLINDAILTLPLVLHNTGPAPAIVRAFQLRLASGRSKGRVATPMLMSWTARQGQLELVGPSGGTRTSPAPFSVGGRSTVDAFIEFGNKDLDLRPGPFTASVFVRLGQRAWWDRLLRPSDREGWTHLLTFTLNTQIPSDSPDTYITRTNDPQWDV
jgi:hypothetical protein